MILIPEGKKLVLASKSPRRQQLLHDLGYQFEVRTRSVDESHPEHMQGREIAEYLAGKKASAFEDDLAADEIILTSDTVVWCEGESLAKAGDEAHAREMLTKLSGRSHRVISGVCLMGKGQKNVFSDTTTVHFRQLSAEEIDHYITNYHPFDKAGAYGIQEWIGMRAITKIEGSYFTVMGLPTHLIHENLQQFG